jgi:hypothetical protein
VALSAYLQGEGRQVKGWQVVLLALAVGLAGCSKKVATAPSMGFAGEKPQNGALLAYAHSLDIDLSKADIGPRMQAMHAACVEGKFGRCNVLTINQDSTSGSLHMRIVPEGVEGMVGLAAKGGKVASRHTAAEDIGKAVHDTQRDRDELERYSTRLEELAARKGLAVSDLISISHEQAVVAGKRRLLEEAAASQQERLETNELALNFRDPSAPRDDMDFGDIWRNLLGGAQEGIGDALSMLGYGLPFLVLAFPLVLFWWWCWRRVTRRWRTSSVKAS